MEDILLLKAELQSIIDESNDNIVVANGAGIVLRASKNCYDIYGVAKEKVIGKSVYTLEEEGVFTPSITVQVLQEKKRKQVMQTTEKGRKVMATGIPIYNEHHDIVRVISFSHDLTEIEQLKSDYEQIYQKMAHYELELERYKDHSKAHVVTKSDKMERIWQLATVTAQSDATVLLLGESGVGKSLFAREIHERSERKGKKLIEVNCGAIPATLIESELFGYEKGAFTGASKTGKKGLFELADQGTLFLDEIAEMPLALQVKLLKAIEEKVITRVGGFTPIKVDFRLIAATNQDIAALVAAGKFRQDLYYRLNVIQIDIPALRERQEEIYALAQVFLNKYNEKYNKNMLLEGNILPRLMQYHWPGNIRELENTMERYVITGQMYVMDGIEAVPSTDMGKVLWTLDDFEKKDMTLKDALTAIEKKALKEAYEKLSSTYEIATYLGMSQSTVVRRLMEWGVKSK